MGIVNELKLEILAFQKDHPDLTDRQIALRAGCHPKLVQGRVKKGKALSSDSIDKLRDFMRSYRRA